MSSDLFSRIPAANQAYLPQFFFDNAAKVRVHTFSSFWIVYTLPFNRGISGDTFVLQLFLCVLLVASVPGSKILEKRIEKSCAKTAGKLPFSLTAVFRSHALSLLARFFRSSALTKSLAQAILLAALVPLAPTKRLFFRTAPIGSLELQDRFCLARKPREKKLRFV